MRKILLFTTIFLSLLTSCQPAPTSSPAPTTIPTSPPPLTPTPTADACQIPTFKASDALSDCVNNSGGPVACAGLDLAGVEAGLLISVPEVGNGPNHPAALPGAGGYTGFVVTFADPLQAAEEFALHLYLDLDQNAATGFDMSSGASALPGIDRLIGVTLPSGESWTQVIAKGGYEAEIIKDGTQVSARVVGGRVIVLVARALLDDRSVASGEHSPPALVAEVPVRYALRLYAGGALVDAFTLYVGTTRNIGALDFFNGDQDIHTPLAMTVPQEALFPVCAGGS